MIFYEYSFARENPVNWVVSIKQVKSTVRLNVEWMSAYVNVLLNDLILSEAFNQFQNCTGCIIISLDDQW